MSKEAYSAELVTDGQPGLADTALIADWRQGNREAVAVLYRRHYDDVMGFARSLLRNEHDAQDVVQEAFRKTISAVDNGFGPQENFRAYLYTSVRALSSSWWSKNTREFPVEVFPLEGVPQEDPGLEAVHQASDHEHLLRALQTLPDRWQKVLWYTDVLQEPPRVIAPLMGVAPNAVSALIRRARKGLRKAYLESGPGEELAAKRGTG